MAELSPVLLQLPVGDKTYSAREMRLAVGAPFARDQTGLAARSGVVGAGSLLVHQTGSASQSVEVDPGIAVIQGSGASQGAYVCANDAVETVALDAAHATLPRIDLVYAAVLDDVDGVAGGSAWRIDTVTGTAAASPVEPVLPQADAIKLAAISRAAGDNTVANADITDRRVRAAAEGGMQVVGTVTDIVSPTEGMAAYETTTDLVKIHTGSTWRPLVPGASVNDPRWVHAEVAFPNFGDLTSGSFTTIATFGAFSVPWWAQDGAAHAIIRVSLTAAIITAAGRFEIRTGVGATAGTATGMEAPTATSQHTAVAGQDFTIPAATTTITVVVQARRSAGSGGLRVSAASLSTATLDVLIKR